MTTLRTSQRSGGQAPAPVTPEAPSGIEYVDKPEGPVAAAIIAAGVGAVALGFFTTLVEISAGAKNWLQWNDRVGPLSGKTIMAVIVWLIAWAGLHLYYRNKAIETRTALIVGLILIGVGVVGTFPMFFQAFA